VHEDEPENHNKPVQEQGVGESPFYSLAQWEEYDPGRGDHSNEKEWLHSQAKSLVSWAKECGYLISSDEWKAKLAFLENLEGGREHNVFHSLEDARVFKYTIPPKFGIQEYIPRYAKNQLLANSLFDDDVRFEGILEIGYKVSIVISQPYIEGVKPTEIEIEQWFWDAGFKNIGLYHNGT